MPERHVRLEPAGDREQACSIAQEGENQDRGPVSERKERDMEIGSGTQCLREPEMGLRAQSLREVDSGTQQLRAQSLREVGSGTQQPRWAETD